MTDLTDERITEIASTQYPAGLMTACTITKEFQALLDPTEPFEYATLLLVFGASAVVVSYDQQLSAGKSRYNQQTDVLFRYCRPSARPPLLCLMTNN